MARLKPLPQLWLISDARNDAALEHALARLPRGSGFIFRHYHLAPAARRARFAELARLARARGHVTALSGSRRQAQAWHADLAYGPRGDLVPVHCLRELARAQGAAGAGGAAAVLISPVFATRSHPGAGPLGPLRFRLLAARALVPVIALGGMNRRAASRLDWTRWAAIDAFLPAGGRARILDADSRRGA